MTYTCTFSSDLVEELGPVIHDALDQRKGDVSPYLQVVCVGGVLHVVGKGSLCLYSDCLSR